MFTVAELARVAEREDFKADYQAIQDSLVAIRFGRPPRSLNGDGRDLRDFVAGVLASAPRWTYSEGTDLLRRAGQIAELLGLVNRDARMSLHAALLYELAELPAVAGAVAPKEGLPRILREFFRREGPFGLLTTDHHYIEQTLSQYEVPRSLFHLGLACQAEIVARFEHGVKAGVQSTSTAQLREAARSLSCGVSVTEVNAFAAVAARRADRATRSNVPTALVDSLEAIRCPTELFRAQIKALDEGLLDTAKDSWGFAAPTGSGKSFLTRVLIADLLRRDSSAKALYVVPSRALVAEVTSTLSTTLSDIGVKVISLSAQLVDLDDMENEQLEQASVIVLTPEKADLLLRLQVKLLDDVRLVVVDEAHHIEAGTRGILLELYLWRLRRIRAEARFVFLSAVAPNIHEIVGWAGARPHAATFGERSTRMRAGVYRLAGAGRDRHGVIEYSDGTSIRIVEQADKRIREGIAQLALQLSEAGPVLVVAKGRREAEQLANKMRDHLEKLEMGHLSEEELAREECQRLDARLEREMYAAVEMRKLVPWRVAYHHAGLPPGVRWAVEDAIRAGLIRYVFATTTLAEGVNFPFSSVIVQSLALREGPEAGRPAKYHPVSPRSFWNIAGRAGRPGSDREGQAILFEPSLGAERVGITLEAYLNPKPLEVPPVRSALAESVSTILSSLDDGSLKVEQIDKPKLDETLPREVHGAINLVRVGIVHARASGIATTPEEIFNSSLAAAFMPKERRPAGAKLFSMQAKALDTYLALPNAASVNTIARLGLSIETLTALHEWITGLEQWQLERLKTTVRGGAINFEQVRYVVGPVAARMAELEGPRLGGFYSDVIVQWLSGVPFTRIKAAASYDKRIEDLISVIYSRVQYLLPWGLYAADELARNECAQRDAQYEGELRQLAYLADAGVPNFDAMRLSALGFERVDATRLANAYRGRGGTKTGVDIVGWLRSTERQQLERIVRSPDSRRLDHDFRRMLDSLRSAPSSRQ